MVGRELFRHVESDPHTDHTAYKCIFTQINSRTASIDMDTGQGYGGFGASDPGNNEHEAGIHADRDANPLKYFNFVYYLLYYTNILIHSFSWI